MALPIIHLIKEILMNTTQIIGEAPGIQYQKKTDKTETKTNQSLTDTIIIGRFMRGRFDAPMTIHKGNIRGELGLSLIHI